MLIYPVMELIFDPRVHGSRMKIVCFISGSGTNYQKIVERDSQHDYFVFTNRPNCEGAVKALRNGHPVITLSHLPYLKGVREKYRGAIPRNCSEREIFEQDVWRLVENQMQGKPDLVCLAGYDQWFTDWSINRYYPNILNVHPGDTTKGYIGLHWIPTAQAILAGEKEIRTTLFLADAGEDTGPVLAQSSPLNIAKSLEPADRERFQELIKFASERSVTTYDGFMQVAEDKRKDVLRQICENLQSKLKTAGDWEVYPFVVHNLIARGRVGVEQRRLFIDGKELAPYGLRMENTAP